MAHAACIIGQAIGANGFFGLDDFANTVQEPRIKGGHIVNFIICQTITHRLRNGAHPIWCLLADRGNHGGFLWRAFYLNFVKAGQARFHRCQCFLQRFVNRTTNRHSFTNRLHRCGQMGFGPWEFFEREFWDFGDDIIDCWFKGRRRYLGNVIVQFIQRIADCQFCSNFRNRETRRLGRQGRRP